MKTIVAYETCIDLNVDKDVHRVALTEKNFFFIWITTHGMSPKLLCSESMTDSIFEVK